MAYNPGEIQEDCVVVDAVAGGAVTKGYFVVANASTSKFTLSAGAKPTGVVGVAMTAASADAAPLKVALFGTVSAVAGGAIKKFNLVSVTSAGKAEAATVDTDYIVGIALEDATADGDVILVKLAPAFTNINTT